MNLIIKKDSSFNTDFGFTFYPGNETNYYFYIDDTRVAWCEGAIRQKINSGVSYFLSVIEVEEKYRKKGYSIKVLEYVYNDLGFSITPVNIKNEEYWEYLYSRRENKFVLEAPLSKQELEEHKTFWRSKK